MNSYDSRRFFYFDNFILIEFLSQKELSWSISLLQMVLRGQESER